MSSVNKNVSEMAVHDSGSPQRSADSKKGGPPVTEEPNAKFFESLKLRQIWKSDSTKTSSESICQNYKILRRISDGAFGSVFLAIRKQDKRRVAIKIVPIFYKTNKEPPCKEIAENHPWIESLSSEINLLIHLKGVKGVIGLLEVHLSESDTAYVLIQETFSHCEDMFEYVIRRGRMTEPEARHYFVQVVEILRRMYDNGVYHMDIKDENILINLKSRQATLLDLGGAQWVKNEPYTYFNGTDSYCTPEWAVHRKYDGMQLTSWCLGILLVLMTTGDCPFKGLEHGKSNVTYVMPPHFSPAMQSLITKCMSKDPTLRPTIEEVLNDPWTKGENMETPDLAELEKRKHKPLPVKVLEEEKPINVVQ